jgi:hypothetical protein
MFRGLILLAPYVCKSTQRSNNVRCLGRGEAGLKPGAE